MKFKRPTRVHFAEKPLSKKKPSKSKPGTSPKGAPLGRSSTSVRVRQRPGEQAWELIHPRCVVERSDDIVEVQKMLAMGETEIATDELRWLLNDCPEFIAAHRLLGEIALEEEDFELARGHFSIAYKVGVKALTAAGNPAPLPYTIEANQAFIEAGKGLIYCLQRLDKREIAQDVMRQLLACDPTDTLGIKNFLTS